MTKQVTLNNLELGKIRQQLQQVDTLTHKEVKALKRKARLSLDEGSE